MSDVSNVKCSEYMPWAKTSPKGCFNLATSGLMNYPLRRLPVTLEDLEISVGGAYGYAPLQAALAAHCAVPEDCIAAALGATGANLLAMSALLDPGDEVLMEHPVYEPILAVAHYLGASVKRFSRRPENGFALDPAEIERTISPRTRLIAITNLHNPSSALTSEDTMQRVGEIAKSVGAHVVVDEVYLDAAFDRAPRSAFHLGETFVVTNSLTKVYGLSGLRCGWVLAAPDLVQRMWRIADLLYVIPAHVAERLSVIALAHLREIREFARTLLETNRAVLNEFLGNRPELGVAPLEFGTVVFPRLPKGNATGFNNKLIEKYDTSVVPGEFFEMPEHFRIGIGGDTEQLREGLRRIGDALGEIGSRES